MIPKKIYLRNEELEDNYTCERMVSCDVPARGLDVEYTDMSQVWHDASEEPKNVDVIFENKRGYCRSFALDLPQLIDASYWKDIVSYYSVKRWAYLSDILPKGGEE